MVSVRQAFFTSVGVALLCLLLIVPFFPPRKERKSIEYVLFLLFHISLFDFPFFEGNVSSGQEFFLVCRRVSPHGNVVDVAGACLYPDYAKSTFGPFLLVGNIKTHNNNNGWPIDLVLFFSSENVNHQQRRRCFYQMDDRSCSSDIYWLLYEWTSKSYISTFVGVCTPQRPHTSFYECRNESV